MLLKSYFALALLLLGSCANTSSKVTSVDLAVQNNRSTAVTNLKVGTTTYGNVASGATTAAKSVSPGTYSVTADSGESGSITVSDSKSTATLVISSTGSMSIQQ